MTGTDGEWLAEQEHASDLRSECDHAEAEIDIATGELLCHCGYTCILSGDELLREAAVQSGMMEACFRQEKAGG